MSRNTFAQLIEPSYQNLPFEVHLLLDRFSECPYVANRIGEPAKFHNQVADCEAVLRNMKENLLCGSAFVLSRYNWYSEARQSAAHTIGILQYVTHAVQIQRDRLSLPIAGNGNAHGVTLSVCDGLLRFDFDVHEKYGAFVYFGLGVSSVFKRMKQLAFNRYPGRDSHPQDLIDWANSCIRIAQSARGELIGKMLEYQKANLIPGWVVKEEKDERERPKGTVKRGSKATGGVWLFDSGSEGNAQ